MGFLGKVRLGVTVGMLVFVGAMPTYVGAFYEPHYQVPEEDRENYMVIEEDLGEYEVQEGDCLWGIAEEFLGSGEDYWKLVELNSDVVANPDLIYPHMSLQIKRNVYVKKRQDSSGTYMGEYRFGGLPGWRVGLLSEGDVFSNFAFTGQEGEHIVFLIRDKGQDGVDSLSDWESSRKIVEEYVEEKYADRISDLDFQHYRSEDGTEIYLFSYIYTVDGEWYGYRGTLPVHVCHAVCRTDHIQAEFTGFDIHEGMEDVVRYLAASFEELPATGQKDFTVNDSNMMLEPSKAWELPGVHNSFAWIEEYFDTIFEGMVETVPEEKSAKDRILNQ